MEKISRTLDSLFNADKYDWFYFDLDGTLHDFVYASTKANQSVIRIFSEAYKIEYQQVELSYNTIFKNSQKTHFVSNSSSNENRLVRFNALIEEYSKIGISSYFEYEMLHEYNMNFSKNITPFKNVIKLFTKLKKKEKKIAIVTEGPHDAQEFVLQQLGLIPLKDALITSSYYNLSKSEGLFKQALELTKASSRDVLILGDSIERDILPAKELKIDTILVDHHKKFEDYNGGFVINNFDELIEFV